MEQWMHHVNQEPIKHPRLAIAPVGVTAEHVALERRSHTVL
jgi:hypothetical protein